MTKYNSLIEKADFFRNIQTWPLNDVLNYKGWLNNFSNTGDKEIASYILDFFMFYSRAIINQMLKSVIGYCGYHFSLKFSDWRHDDFMKRCYYSFIPGETVKPTDSGHLYVRKLRDELKIPEDHILNHEDLYRYLQNTTEAIPVILVDDFLGSGAQCYTAWNKYKIQNHTLSDIACHSNHQFIYAPLIANHVGYKRVKETCIGLNLITCHILNHEYNLFDPECFCWKNDRKLYDEGIKLILEKSRKENIPFSNGKNVIDVRGFDEQGLAIAFDSGVPDAIPAFFYWCSNTWTPLIKKEYKRNDEK